MNIDTITHHYAIAALWSSTGANDEPLDSEHGIEDIAPDTLQAMRDDVTQFVALAEDLLTQAGQSDEQIGHDFWLTRHHHGAGFWDRGLGEVGDKLTSLAQTFPELYLYIGDDGMIYS